MILELLFLFQEFGCFFSDHQQKVKVNVRWIYACVYQPHTSKATVREQHSSVECSCLLLKQLRSDVAQNCFQIQSKLVHQEVEYRLCYLYLFLYYNRTLLGSRLLIIWKQIKKRLIFQNVKETYLSSSCWTRTGFWLSFGHSLTFLWICPTSAWCFCPS